MITNSLASNDVCYVMGVVHSYCEGLRKAITSRVWSAAARVVDHEVSW